MWLTFGAAELFVRTPCLPAGPMSTRTGLAGGKELNQAVALAQLSVRR